MQADRRIFTFGLGAALLSGCGGGGYGAGPGTAPADEPAMRAVANPGFDTWIAGFRPRAAAAGISGATLNRALPAAGFLPGVVERDRNQTEFNRTLEDYLAIAASDERVATGRSMFARHRALLGGIESRYGVDPAIVTAIWGLESRYGARRGDIPTISALATLAYDGRRGAFFEKQLIAALQILDRGDTTPSGLTGSWAGAMGHTQFIPTSYQAYAVDFGGDGRRDIWSDDPTDALASTANYLARMGWSRGVPWGYEVRVPAGAMGLSGSTRSLADWSGLGVTRAAGGGLSGGGQATLLVPESSGPGFLTFSNFGVIRRYNNSTNYVIGIGHLADRIRGGGPIQASFPPDRYGLRKDDRIRLQQRLTARGYDTGGADGVIGPDTQAAIRAFQQANGMAPTGEPSTALLSRLG
ncbi:lytic murein transglycosylase [Mesobaculum littorinae]|uniref:Lytic murein transglycosylase n=1 Tax=Mesobaculum littorinae TaxID=2486419 RepID=A0A438ALN4_9RHOB|nr:lytic murein transglycosylase [Mesobaculum littorinae]RVV99582.1 lytic murein transglycosylase [Mesobaculum littorinae]